MKVPRRPGSSTPGRAGSPLWCLLPARAVRRSAVEGWLPLSCRPSATMSSAGSGTTKAARKLAIPRDRLKTSVTGRAANLRRSVTAYSLGSKNAKLDDPTLSHRERQRRYRDRIRPDRRADRGRRHRDDHIGRYKLDQHVQHSRQQPVRAGPVVRRASREGGELGVIHGVAGRFSAVGAAAAPAGRPRNAIPCWPVPIAWCSARAFDVSTARRSAAAASQEPRPDGSRAGWRLRQSHHLLRSDRGALFSRR